MAPMMCTASLLLLHATLAVEVHPDWNLLTDFTADYNITSQKAMGEEGGTLHVNVLSGAVKIQSHGSIELPPPSDETPFFENVARSTERDFLGPTVTGHGEFRLNAEKGFASLRAKLEAKEKLEFCVKLNLPPVLLQKGLVQLKQALPAAEKQAQQGLARAPHESGVVDGKSVAIYPVGSKAILSQLPNGSKASLSLLPNGVPVELDVTGRGVTKFKFTNWHAGAGEVDEQDCHAITASDFLATPGGLEMLGVLDRGMAALGTMSQYIHAGSMRIPKPSVLARQAAKVELAQMYVDQSFSRASMAAAAGGIAGAFLAATVVIAVLRPSRRLLQEPLISTTA